MLHSDVFSPRACRLTTAKVVKRYEREGKGFLTKTLPRLGKNLDRALTGEVSFDSMHEHKMSKHSKLPKLLGEFFVRVFDNDGRVLPSPCVASIKVLRQFLYLFYKYELGYTPDQEQAVVSKFLETEKQLEPLNQSLALLKQEIEGSRTRCTSVGVKYTRIIRRSKILLERILGSFNPKDIVPKHGPGVVSTKETLWDKYSWTNVPERLLSLYPLDEYFYTNLGDVCDNLQSIRAVGDEEFPAQVILVPKDSRGPRLISCEPLVFQWIQQGLSKALIKHVEEHRLTATQVNFTDQSHNRCAALFGSQNGKYSTLDLNEASDRVSMGLVRLLYPDWFTPYLECCRSQRTKLPDGKIISMGKFAPMGSALCFPILALTVYAILHSGAPDAYTRERILVYGDDVIVPTAYAADAIEQLEFFGLKVNRDKSCINGLFRESCGMDAYKGIDVTPVRLRTVWSSSPSPDVYTSWISYSNSFYDKRYVNASGVIASELQRIYRCIPNKDLNLSSPSLHYVSDDKQYFKSRWNSFLQKREYLTWDVVCRAIHKNISGWKMLLRHFVEGHRQSTMFSTNSMSRRSDLGGFIFEPFSVSLYTKRYTSKLVKRWR
jgi:hypothetical protein